MITIKNLRHEKPKYAYDVRVDRSSVLGNPYYLKSEGERNYVCDLYQERFNKIIANDEHWLEVTLISQEYRKRFIEELLRLLAIHETFGQLNLFCWCAPKRRHAETIKKFLDQVILGEKEVKECLRTLVD